MKKLLLTLLLSFFYFDMHCANIITLADQTIDITDAQLELLINNSVILNGTPVGNAHITLATTQETFNFLMHYLETKKLPGVNKEQLKKLGSLAADLRINELVELVNEELTKPQKKPREEEQQPKSPKKPKIEEIPLSILEVPKNEPRNEMRRKAVLKISRNSGTIKNIYELSGKSDITLDDLEPIPLQLTENNIEFLINFAMDLDLEAASQITKKIKALSESQQLTLMFIANYLEMQPLLEVTANVTADPLSEPSFIKNLYENQRSWDTFINFSGKFPRDLIDKIVYKKIFRQVKGTAFQSPVRSVIINPLGTVIYSAAAFSIARWSLSQQAEENYINVGANVNTMALAPNGLKLAVSTPDKLLIYDNQLQKIHTILSPQFTNMDISVDNTYLYALSSKILSITKLTSFNAAIFADYRNDATKNFTALACHPQMPNQFAVGINNEVHLSTIDYKTNKITIIKTFIPNPNANPNDISNEIKSIAFSKDGKHLIIGSEKTITVWDISSGQLKNTLSGHAGIIGSVAVSQDNNFLASIARVDKSIIIWNLNDGKKILQIPTTEFTTAIYFNPVRIGLALGEDQGQVSYYFLDAFLLKFAKEISIDQLMLYLIIKQQNINKNQNLPAYLEETFNSFSDEMKQNIWQ